MGRGGTATCRGGVQASRLRESDHAQAEGARYLTLADGRVLSYSVIGQGPLAICLPGGPGFPAAYLGDLGGLAGSRTLLRVNPRGTGESDPAASYNPDDYVSDLEELCAQLDLVQVDVIGHSFGGLVGLRWASTHPERIRKLVSVGGLSCMSDELSEEMERLTEKRSDQPWYQEIVDASSMELETDEDMAKCLYSLLPVYFHRYGARAEKFRDSMKPGNGGRCSLAAYLAYAESVGTLDVRPDLNQITAATLLVVGDDDFICGPIAGRQIAERMDPAVVATKLIRNVGHLPFVERPRTFVRIVEQFLSA